MTRYSQELGVQCVFCHTQNPQTQQVDFASDESPAKLTARVMIGMVRDINDKYLAQVSDRRYAVPISCGNCHQGQAFPPAFEVKAAP
jgi:nitrate reductase cytochrome c-type subunit